MSNAPLRPNSGGVLFRQAGADGIQRLFNEAVGHHQAGNLSQSEQLYRQVLSMQPLHDESLHLLGVLANHVGRHDVAFELIANAIAINGSQAAYHSDLGNALQAMGRLEEAIASFTVAVRLKPSFTEAYFNMGNAMQVLGRLEEAVAAYAKAIHRKPDFAEARSNLGNALQALGQLDKAIVEYKRALRSRPEFPEIQTNLGNTLLILGRTDEAIVSYTEALRIKADCVSAHSNLILSMHYHPAFGAKALFERALEFSATLEKSRPCRSFENSLDDNRRLRIGYVSGDFKEHAVFFFLNQILKNHNQVKFEVFSYSNSSQIDNVTKEIQLVSGHWRNIVGLTDEAAADLIAADCIDVLIDLSGHTSLNRLGVFALKPAPVQVTWLGYSGTTGLTAIDYILGDKFVSPNDSAPHFTEEIWRLPNSYLCFSPPETDLPVQPTPALSGEPITFGSFNNNTKTSFKTIELWSRILKSVKDSRLFLNARALASADARRVIIRKFAEHNISSSRILLEGGGAQRSDILSAYNRVDVALDPTPYGGATTTAEALWMGVPVVTLRGETWAGRVSESILTTAGLSEFVASTPDDYVERTVNLVEDLHRLQAIRSGLRSTLENSPFCDGPTFTAHLEAAYQTMWRNWCRNRR